MSETIKLTYKDLNDQAFIQGVRGLVNHKWDALTTAYKLKRIMDMVDSQSKIAFKTWNDIIAKEVEFEGEGQDRKPKDMAKYKAQEDAFLAMECVVPEKRKKLHVTELLGYKFSVVDLVALSPILTGMDDLEEDKVDEKTSETQKS